MSMKALSLPATALSKNSSIHSSYNFKVHSSHLLENVNLFQNNQSVEANQIESRNFNFNYPTLNSSFTHPASFLALSKVLSFVEAIRPFQNEIRDEKKIDIYEAYEILRHAFILFYQKDFHKLVKKREIKLAFKA